MIKKIFSCPLEAAEFFFLHFLSRGQLVTGTSKLWFGSSDNIPMEVMIMGMDMNIGTISGLTISEILDLMVTKKIGIADNITLAAVMQTISTEWGSCVTAQTITNTLAGSAPKDVSISKTKYTTFVDTDFKIQGTNGYNKRVKVTSCGTMPYNLMTLACDIRITLTCNGKTYIDEIINNSSFNSYSSILTIDTPSTLGIVEGHVKCEVKLNSAYSNNTESQYNPGCNVYADTYA